MTCGRKTFPKFITHLPELYYILLSVYAQEESQKVLKKKKRKKERKKGNCHNQQLTNKMSANWKGSPFPPCEDILVVQCTTSFPGVTIH